MDISARRSLKLICSYIIVSVPAIFLRDGNNVCDKRIKFEKLGAKVMFNYTLKSEPMFAQRAKHSF